MKNSLRSIQMVFIIFFFGGHSYSQSHYPGQHTGKFLLPDKLVPALLLQQGQQGRKKEKRMQKENSVLKGLYNPGIAS